MSTAEPLTSRLALAVTMPPVNMTPVEHVELRLLYDAFNPEEVETHELEWRAGATLESYIGELPTDQEWMVFFNGEEIELEQAVGLKVSKGDRIGVLLIPQGSGVKSVLRVVLQAAAIALAFVPGIGWAAALAINVAVGLINAFLLTPKQPKNNSDDDGRSYGIDGAKNSATEGIPYPIVYGEFRVAGNFSDTFTQNIGDNQYLYLRSILNDGLIDSVTDIEVNEQPIGNFKEIQTRIALGSLDQPVNDWFSNAIVQVNKGQRLDTGWNTHITTSAVDKIRWDVVFTNGLVDIDDKKGTYKRRSVTFEMQVQRIDPSTGQPLSAWQPVQTGPSTHNPADGFAGLMEALAIEVARLKAQAPAYDARESQSSASRPGVEYRPVGDTEWQSFGQIEPIADNYVYDASGDGTLAGNTNITPMATGVFERQLEPGDYEFRGVNGAQIVEAQTWPSSQSLTRTVTDNRTRQIRHSFETGRLAKGYYNARIRRTNPQGTNNYHIDEVFLSDVAEIECDQVPQRGTASLALCIRLNEQLNGIPTLTAKVRGSVVQKYDIDGNPTVKEWSNNPAWIGLDILCGVERGGLVSLSRIDWPAWLAFAQYCDANGITFNGVFDTGSNLGDALNTVLRIGHAAPVPFGTKISVAIDRHREPVAAFTSASILKGTMQVTYMSMQDRANEFELTFYDKMDRNKAKTIRYVDPKAVSFNEMPRKASVSMPGIDNIAQARKELWRMVYANRLIIRTLSFDSFMESISMAQGEVALIQHDMMEWANNGRLKPGSTTTRINLDQAVTMEAGQSYSALVHFSAVSRGQYAVHSVVGTKVLVPHNHLGSDGAPRVTRMVNVATDDDYQVISITGGATYDTVQLDRAPVGVAAGMQVRFWDTDVIEERAVDSVIQNADGTTSVNLATALPAAPEALSNFIFGKVAKVRKPYVLTGISGTGIEKRKLTFVEYHEGVYAAPEVEIPVPVERVSDRQVGQAKALYFDYERLVEAKRRLINTRVHWSSEGTINYGGADVYLALNGGAFRAVTTVMNATEAQLQLSPGDEVTFKVVAFNKRGDRAPAAAAPEIRGTLIVQYADLDPVTNLQVQSVAFQVDGKVRISWTPPADATGVDAYEVQYRLAASEVWTSLGTAPASPVEIAGLPTGAYVARVRSVCATSVSVWVEKAFTVVIAPGSLLANWSSANDRDGTPIGAPTLPSTGSVEHTLNRDGSANISFEWLWEGDQASIDGFIVEVNATSP